MKIQKGIYKYYKGKEYEVIFTAFDIKNKKELVIYREVDKDKILAISLESFQEEIEINGEKRFKFTFERQIEQNNFKEKYLRALADYQNLLKQTLKEKEEFAKYANENLILEILPVYENLKTSLNHLSEEAKTNGWAKGIEYVINQFKKVLVDFGVEEIKALKEKFNHNYMEAIEEETTDNKDLDGLVAKEIMTGYKLKDKVIQAARVVVYKFINNN